MSTLCRFQEPGFRLRTILGALAVHDLGVVADLRIDELVHSRELADPLRQRVTVRLEELKAFPQSLVALLLKRHVLAHLADRHPGGA